MARRGGELLVAVALLATITLMTLVPPATVGAGTGASTTITSPGGTDATAPDDPTGTTAPSPAVTVAPVAPTVGSVPTASLPTASLPMAPPPTAPAPNLLDDDDIDSGPPVFLIAGLALSLATAAVIGIALVLLRRRPSRSDKQT